MFATALQNDVVSLRTQHKKKDTMKIVSFFFGCSCQARTDDIMINSHALYRLS